MYFLIYTKIFIDSLKCWKKRWTKYCKKYYVEKQIMFSLKTRVFLNKTGNFSNDPGMMIHSFEIQTYW